MDDARKVIRLMVREATEVSPYSATGDCIAGSIMILRDATG